MQNYGKRTGFDDWLEEPEHERFLEAHARADYKHIVGITADELTQIYRLVAWYAWSRYDETLGVAFTTYLHKCLLNAKRRLIKDRGSTAFLDEWFAPSLNATAEEGGVPEDKLPADTAETPETMLEAKEIKAIAERELAKLSSRDQDIVLKVVSGYSETYLAKFYKVSQPAIAAVMRKYRSRVRVALLNAGFSPPGAA